MKILHIHDSYHFAGGAEVYFEHITSQLKKQGHEVCTFGFDAKKELQTKTTFCYKKKRSFLLERVWSGYFFNPRVYLRLKKWIKQINPDVIHLHHNYVAPVSVLLACGSIPIVKSVQDFTPLCPNGSCICKDGKVRIGNFGIQAYQYLSWPHYLLYILTYPLLKAVAKKIRAHVAGTQLLASSLKKAGFKNTNYIQFFTPIHEKSPELSKQNEGEVLVISRMIKEKGVQYLIDAFARVAKTNEKAKLTVIGDGSEKENLLAQINDLGIKKRVEWITSVEYNDLKKYFLRAQVVVVPSVWLENGSLVIYDAMAYGRVVVASRIGAIPELVDDGKTGFLCDAASSEDLAKKIGKVLSDKELSKRLSVNAQSRAHKEFTPTKHLIDLQKLYESVSKK